MMAFFFMKSGLVKSVLLERGATVNASWDVSTCLPQIFSAVSERREMRSLRGLIFHDDSAKPHRTWITNEFLLENHVEQYQNAAYSPNLRSCDFLFPKPKKQLHGIRFNDDNEVVTTLEQVIDSPRKKILKTFWKTGLFECTNVLMLKDSTLKK